jgi:hypothetical protein
MCLVNNKRKTTVHTATILAAQNQGLPMQKNAVLN